MADGDITLSVTLEASDIRAKADKLRTTISKMFEGANSANLDKEMQNLLVEMDKLVSKSVEVETIIERMENTRLDNPAFAQLNAQIREAEQHLSALDKEKENLFKLALPTEDITAQIQKIESELGDLMQKREQMLSSGQDTISWAEADPDAYNKQLDSLGEINNKMAVLSTRYQQAEESTESFKTKSVSALDICGKGVLKLSSLFGSLVRTVGSKLIGAFNKFRASIANAFKHNQITTFIKRLGGLLFGLRAMRRVLNAVSQSAKEGLHNLVQYQSDTNATNHAMTELQTSLLFLKNAWASAFAPVINYVMPILTQLIDAIANVGNAIARFVGSLTGQSTVLNAVKVSAGDYAKSLNKVGGSAKKATDRLAQFDDLNVLGKDSEGGGGGADAYTPDPNEMFEYVEAVSPLADMIKQAWADSDFTGLGSALKDKIISALQSIDWDDIKSKVTQGATFAGQFLVGLFGDPELFKELGSSLGELFNTATLGISSFLDEIEKIDFGGNLAEMLNEFLRTADFETAGDNVNRVITDIINNIDSFVTKLDADEVAKAIEDFINGLDVGEIVATASQCLLDVGELILKVTGKLVVDWGNQLGEKWWKDVSEGITTTIDGEEVTLEPEFDADENPIIPLLDTWITQAGEHITKQAFSLAQLFGFEGDESTFLSNIETSWNSAWDSFWGSDKEATVTSMGDMFNSTTTMTAEDLEFLSTTFTDVGTNISEFFTSIPEKAEEFKTSMDAKWEEIKTNLSETWESIKTTASTKWEELKSSISLKIQETKDKVTEKVTVLKETLAQTWQDIKDKAYEKFVLMRVSIVEAFNTLKEAIKTPINGFISVIESLVNRVISGVNSIIDSVNALPDIKFTNPFTGADYALGVTLPRLSTVSIPRLAEGAVIPPNKEFMAMLGDQSHGTNIEAPLDTIKQAVAEELSAQIGVLESGFASVVSAINNKDLVIGDKEIGKANARYAKSQNIIRGTSF